MPDRITVTPDWPSHSEQDLAMLIVNGRGTIECDSADFREVPLVWWRRLLNWLTPWKPHIRTYIRVPKDFWNPPPDAPHYHTKEEIEAAFQQAYDLGLKA